MIKEFLKISKITKKKYEKPVPVYCINVEPYHRIVINNGYVTKQSINFGFLFGMQASTYTNSYIRKEWTLKQCKEFIKDKQIETIANLYRNQNDPFLIVGTYMRNSFFTTYKNLLIWHKDLHNFARKWGYIRTVHGARRHLPQLLHIGENFQLEANLKNIAINSPVQNFEIVMISRAMREFHEYCKVNNKKSRLWTTTHDSVAFYIHKSEIEEMKKIIPAIMTKDYPEYDSIPIEVEGDLSDPRSDIPTWWGYGNEWGGKK